MDAVTTHSDFGAQENKICHSFHFSYSQLLFAAGFFFFIVATHLKKDIMTKWIIILKIGCIH